MKRWRRNRPRPAPGGVALPLGAVALVCLALVSPAPLLAVEGKALFQGPGRLHPHRSERQRFQWQALASSSFAGPPPPDANFAGADLPGSAHLTWQGCLPGGRRYCALAQGRKSSADALHGPGILRVPIFSGALLRAAD